MTGVDRAEKLRLDSVDSLIEVANNAHRLRLDKIDFEKQQKMYFEGIVNARFSGEFSLKAFMAKFSFVRKHMLSRSRHSQLNYTAFCKQSDAIVNDFLSNIHEYHESYELLTDFQSKQTFLYLLAGRMLIDYRYGMPFAEVAKNCKEYYCIKLPTEDNSYQHFFDEDEILVDCGAFEGDTLQEFITNNKPPSKYIGFEPVLSSCILANKIINVAGVNGVVHNFAVHKTNGIIKIKKSSGMCKVSETGTDVVKTISLDEMIQEPVTAIKMDIEGSEYEALEGATEILKKYKPKLAICIYHKISDYRKISLLIKQINPNYTQFYMRYLSPYFTKTMGFVETVLYVR